MPRHSVSFSLLFFSLIFLGCGTNVALKGRVVFDDDGSPLTAGTVLLATPSMQSRGHLDRDGHFTVGTVGAKDGIPPGTYAIAFVDAVEYLPDGNYRALLEDKWYSPQTSGLTVEIDKSTKNLEIRVTRPQVSGGG